MASNEENNHFVDRKESVMKCQQASQISAAKVVLGVEVTKQVDQAIADTEVHGLLSADHVHTSARTERSEVNVEIQGLRETTFSVSETVVTNRIRTIFDRSLSGSTSSTELDHRELVADSSHGADDSVFGEASYSGGSPKERTTSDSYYISQTYQVNSEDNSSKSVTAVRSVSFRSSKDVTLGDHDKVDKDPTLHFVDRLEEIIMGKSPDVVGSPKENNVRFLWYDNEHEDVEALKRIQIAREDVQQLIESTYMVSDIADVVGDNYTGPESKPLSDATSNSSTLNVNPHPGMSTELASSAVLGLETQLMEVASHYSNETVQGSHILSTTEASHYTISQPDPSCEMTWESGRTFDAHQSDTSLHSVSKPVDFPKNLQPVDSLTSGRSSPLTLAYSPGMAIRSYALEELAERKFRLSPERMEAEAKTLRFDEESSGVDVDKGSSVDDPSSLISGSRIDVSTEQNIFRHAFRTDSLSSQMYSSSFPVQEMSKEDDDESLDKLVDLQSLLVGYKFHDVGIMQESGGICNLAFDDSDEHETIGLTSTDYKSSSVHSQLVASMDLPVQPPAETCRLLLGSQRLHSAVEQSSSYLSSDSAGRAIVSDQDIPGQATVPQGGFKEMASVGPMDTLHKAQINEGRIKTVATSSETGNLASAIVKERGTHENVGNILSPETKCPADTVDNQIFAHGFDHSVPVGEDTKGLTQSVVTAGNQPTDPDRYEHHRTQREVDDITRSKEVEIKQSIRVEAYSSKRSVNVAESNAGNLSSDAMRVTDTESKISTIRNIQSNYSIHTEHTISGSQADNIPRISEADNIASLSESRTTSQSKSAKGSKANKKHKADKAAKTGNVKSDKTNSKAEKADNSRAEIADNARTEKANSKAEKANSKAQKTDISRAEKADSSRKQKTDNAVTEKADIDISVTATKTAVNFKGTENSSLVKVFGDAVADTTTVKHSSDIQNIGFAKDVVYKDDSVDAGSRTRTSAAAGSSLSADGVSSYQTILADHGLKSEMVNLVEDKTFSETEHVQQILQATGVSQIEHSGSSYRLAAASTSIGGYLREDIVNGTVEAGLIKGGTQGGRAHGGGNVRKELRQEVKSNRSHWATNVTRKFNISNKFEASLKSQGAVLRSESMTLAVYFDTPDFDLTLSDCWLRSVNSEWQFHSNFTKLLNPVTKHEYTELENKTSILRSLADVLNCLSPADDSCISLFVHQSGLREFARYTTIRRTYELQGLVIELELPEYGFWVGSVTVTESCLTTLHGALDSITSLWATTGVAALNLLTA